MTPIEITHATLNKRQINSLRGLQAKVETNAYKAVRVSDAQFKAMQQAYTALKAAGAVPADMLIHAKNLGLK